MIGVSAVLIAMAIAIGALAIVAAFIGKIDSATLAKGVGVVSILGGVVAAMMFAVKGVSAKALIPLIGVMLILAELFYILSQLQSFDQASLLNSVIALSIIITALANALLMVSIASKLVNPTEMLVGIAGLTLMIIPLVSLMMALSLINKYFGEVKLGLETAAAISLLMISMAVALALVAAVGLIPIQFVLAGVLALTAMVVPMAAFILALSLMQNIQNAEKNAVLISALMFTMSGLLLILGVLAPLAALGIIGAIALTTLFPPMLEIIASLWLMEGLTNAEENSEILTRILYSMAYLLEMLGQYGPMATLGVPAVIALQYLIAEFAILVAAISGLNELFGDDFINFIDNGIELLNVLSLGLGKVLGSFVSGFMVSAVSLLPEIGDKLSSFYEAATPFLNGLKELGNDPSFGEGVKNLAGIMLAMFGASFLDKISNFLGGGADLFILGTELSSFIVAATPFLIGIKNIEEDDVNKTSILADTITAISKIKINKDLTKEEFKNSLTGFAEGFNAFYEKTKDLDVDSVKAAAEAGTALAVMASKFPNSGGWLGAILGNNDGGYFGEQMGGFGDGLNAFYEKTKDINLDAVKTAAEAGIAVADMASKFPNQGGLLGLILGDNDGGYFGVQMSGFADGLDAFYKKTKDINADSVKTAADAGVALADMASKFPNTGGWLGKIFGENDGTSFGTQMENFGTGMVNFHEKTKEITAETVKPAAEAATILTNALANIPTTGGWLDKIFKGEKIDVESSLSSLGSGLKSFYNSFIGDNSSVNMYTLEKAVNDVSKLIDAMSNIDSVNTSSINSFKTSLSTLAKDGIAVFISEMYAQSEKISESVNDFIKSVSSSFNDRVEIVKEDIKKSAEKLIKYFTGTISDYKIKDDVESLIKKARNSMDSDYNIAAFKDAGANLVSGFVSGINSKGTIVESSSTSIAKKALDAIKKALDIHSPSKETEKLGKFTGLGFVNSLIESGKSVYDAAYDVGRNAYDALKDSLNTVYDILMMDMDFEPRIRPVLDLSNVRQGINETNGLVNDISGFSSTVAYKTSRIMNQDIRNVDGDLESSIKKLNDVLSENQNAPQEINNTFYITGDDPKEIAEDVAKIIQRQVERKQATWG